LEFLPVCPSLARWGILYTAQLLTSNRILSLTRQILRTTRKNEQFESAHPSRHHLHSHHDRLARAREIRNIPPSLPTTALVVGGIYGQTRNPLYLGTTLVYLGLSVAAGSLWAIGLLVPLLWVINVGVVMREERYLERKFGDAYRAYKVRVRRWI
jgi:hypothetical protein